MTKKYYHNTQEKQDREGFPEMMGIDLNRIIPSPYEIWKRDNQKRPEDMN